MICGQWQDFLTALQLVNPLDLEEIFVNRLTALIVQR
jgi:hypothetical protein